MLTPVLTPGDVIVRGGVCDMCMGLVRSGVVWVERGVSG